MENDTYYPPGLTEDETFLKRMRGVAGARPGQPEETAALAPFLTEANFMPGHSHPAFGAGRRRSEGDALQPPASAASRARICR